MKAFAFYLKSESGDVYLTAIDLDNFVNPEEAVDEVVSGCPEELSCLSESIVVKDHSSSSESSFEDEARLREVLYNLIDESHEVDDYE